MTRNDDLRKWRDGLHATFPILGGMRRKKAIEALKKHRNDPAVVPLLAEAAHSNDASIAADGLASLRDLTTQSAIDALCSLWAQQRQPRLGQVIAERGYIAQQPLEAKIRAH